MIEWKPNRYGLLPPSEILRSLFRELTKDELDVLESLLIQDGGATSPIIVRRSTNEILDGYHRWKLCEKHQLPYTIKIVELLDDDLAATWVVHQQVGRRNLSPTHLAEAVNALAQMQKFKVPGSNKLAHGAIEHIADITGQKPNAVVKQIQRAKQFKKVAEKIVNAASQGKVKLTKANKSALSKLGTEEQVVLYDKVQAGEFGGLDEALIAAGVQKPKPPPPEPTPEESDAAAEAKAHEKDAPNKTEQPINHFPIVKKLSEQLIREIDKAGNAHGKGQHYLQCRNQVSDLYDTILAWIETATKPAEINW